MLASLVPSIRASAANERDHFVGGTATPPNCEQFELDPAKLT